MIRICRCRIRDGLFSVSSSYGVCTEIRKDNGCDENGASFIKLHLGDSMVEVLPVFYLLGSGILNLGLTAPEAAPATYRNPVVFGPGPGFGYAMVVF